jgi:hypothetical protein
MLGEPHKGQGKLVETIYLVQIVENAGDVLRVGKTANQSLEKSRLWFDLPFCQFFFHSSEESDQVCSRVSHAVVEEMTSGI